MKTEIKALTGLRGVASFYVVIFHFYQFLTLNSENAVQTGMNKYVQNFFMHGYIGVDLFFVLSAFVMTLSSKKYFEGKFSWSSYKIFMSKRFIRIYPIYIIVVLYGIFFVEHFQKHRIPNYILSVLLLNGVVGGVPVLGHLWSLTAEWIAYLLFPIFMFISYFKTSFSWMFFCLLIGIFTYTLSYLLFHNNFHVFQQFALEVYQKYNSTFRCLGEYFLGIFGFQLLSKRGSQILQSNLVTFLMLILATFLLLSSSFDIFIPLAIMIIIVAITAHGNFLSRILSLKFFNYLGLISYPVYLINSLLSESLPGLQSKLSAITENKFLIYSTLLVFFVSVVIMISHIVTFYIESPLIKFLNKRLNQKMFPF